MNEILEEYKGKILLILGLIFLVIIFLIISSCSKNKYIYTIKSNGNSKLPYIKIKNSDFDYINEDLENQYNEIINSEELDKILDEGKRITNEYAKKKYEEIRKKVGLGR